MIQVSRVGTKVFKWKCNSLGTSSSSSSCWPGHRPLYWDFKTPRAYFVSLSPICLTNFWPTISLTFKLHIVVFFFFLSKIKELWSHWVVEARNSPREVFTCQDYKLVGKARGSFFYLLYWDVLRKGRKKTGKSREGNRKNGKWLGFVLFKNFGVYIILFFFFFFFGFLILAKYFYSHNLLIWFPSETK